MRRQARSGGQRMRNVFIAGLTGYLGHGLAEQLLRRGHRVTGLARPTVCPQVAQCDPAMRSTRTAS
jgi:nucleoside-diphosphate-sugar epimerase